MNITVNGDSIEVPAGHTLANLVMDLAVGDQRIAIEVNEQIVPRSTYEAYNLKPGDHVEVVTAIGGG
ncbi:MAG: sulfur carrier protein ThiS [Arenicellales bacterium]|nr:sulfur carrier protein ThiS [Arenicellales bacterium]